MLERVTAGVFEEDIKNLIARKSQGKMAWEHVEIQAWGKDRGLVVMPRRARSTAYIASWHDSCWLDSE